MHGLCLYSCHIESPCILHVLLFHVIPVFLVYDCFLLLIWIFLLLDMRAVDMRYMESHIYCSRFPLYCSCFPLYCSMLSTELWSSYHVTCIMYCICACYIVYLTYQLIKLTRVWGETRRLIRSYRVMYWIHIVLPLQGMVVLPTDCIAP